MLFNDFSICPCPASDVQHTFGGQKLPCLLYYSQVRGMLCMLQAIDGLRQELIKIMDNGKIAQNAISKSQKNLI